MTKSDVSNELPCMVASVTTLVMCGYEEALHFAYFHRRSYLTRFDYFSSIKCIEDRVNKICFFFRLRDPHVITGCLN